MNFSTLSKQETVRLRDTIDLIASENYCSQAVLNELGSVFSVKYGEGFPGKRYYAGNANTDVLESEVQKLALEVFCKNGGYGVNLQTLSGSVANSLVYLSLLSYGDTIVSLKLDQGGHLSHLHSTSNWNKFFTHKSYSLKQLDENDYEIDITDFENQIKTHKPKLVIIGFSSYPKQFSFKKMCTIAHAYGALVLADIAHINGLVAAGYHDSPFTTDSGDFYDAADIVSMTTHKTLRGPRSSMLFARDCIPEWVKGVYDEKQKSLISMINKTTFPGVLGGPHFNKISALGVALQEVLGISSYPDGVEYKEYISRTIENCKALETELELCGLTAVIPTENHLCLHRLPDEYDSLEIQKKLEDIGIVTNRNTLPYDTKGAYRPSGLRFGTAAITSRGAGVNEMKQLAHIICDCIYDRDTIENLKERALRLVSQLSFYYHIPDKE